MAAWRDAPLVAWCLWLPPHHEWTLITPFIGTLMPSFFRAVPTELIETIGTLYGEGEAWLGVQASVRNGENTS